MAFAADSYPLLGAFLTVLWITGFVLWIWVAIAIFSDIFRSRDLSGFAKAGWVFLIFVLPLLGCLIYLLARGRKMQQHAEEEAAAADLATREYIRDVVAEQDSSDELAQLTTLHDTGALTDDEFESMKAKLP
jgi:hypothetical protein